MIAAAARRALDAIEGQEHRPADQWGRRSNTPPT